MPLVVQNSSQLFLLQNLREVGPTAGLWRELVLKLYQNDFTPGLETALAEFTEADFSGYVAIVLSAGWLLPFVDADGIARMMQAQTQFNHDGGATANTIFGYFVEKDTGELLWAERFVNSVPMAAAVNAISMTLAIATYNFVSAEVVSS